MENLLILLIGVTLGTYQAENIRKVVPALKPSGVDQS